VNNVETLASAPPIIRRGAAWYRSLGETGHAGTKIISLSGDIRRPGNYEVPLGLPLRTLLHDLDVTLDEPSIRSKGSFLGAGGIMVFDDSRDMVDVAHNAMAFFAEESCGKCFPCRIGTQRLTERLAGVAGPSEVSPWIDEITDIGRTMKKMSACGLGIAAPLITDSLIRYFPERIAEHVQSQSGHTFSPTSGRRGQG
jgi:NADH:ubiquinone oxidoreductase subunit F (NADH-binding)